MNRRPRIHSRLPNWDIFRADNGKGWFSRLDELSMTGRLPQSFYSRPAKVVARDLLGKRLVRFIDSERIAGIIVETEAYCDGDKPDLACHGDKYNKGHPTARSEVMFGPAGFAYVYFTYGMHWMFNVVTGEIGKANAVLIRALEPLEGNHLMAAHRVSRPQLEWTNGPAKLASALAIDRQLNGANLCVAESVIWVEEMNYDMDEEICSGPRIGLGNTPEPWLSAPWRYWICNNVNVSRNSKEIHD